MGLLNSDLFVIQRVDNTPGNVPGHYKLTGQQLKEAIDAGETVIYKGTADFRDAGADPSLTSVNVGDLYINDNPVTGPGAWVADILGNEVSNGDRAIWNGTGWDLIHSVGDSGVTELLSQEPIFIDAAVDSTPLVGVYPALKTDEAPVDPRTARSGVVSAIAIDTDVAAGAGDSLNPDAVVPASLLKDTNDDVTALELRVEVNEGDIVTINQDIDLIKEDISTIEGDILTINNNLETITNGGTLSALKEQEPIKVTTAPKDDTLLPDDPGFGETETTVSILYATTQLEGAIKIQATSAGASPSTDDQTAATPAYVDNYYLIKNFASLGDA